MDQIFLYSYSRRDNFEKTRSTGTFGVRDDRSGLATKVQELRPGHLIVIRDSSVDELRFLGHCLVRDRAFDQRQRALADELLWADEISSGRCMYPIRVRVDFVNVPTLDFSRVEWKTLDELGFFNQKGERLLGRQRWAKKLTGNLLSPVESRRFLELGRRLAI